MLHQSLKITAVTGLMALAACSKDDGKKGRSANIPRAKPQVQEAAPVGLQTALTTPQENLAGRFFNPEGGPSNIFQLLTNVDGSIDQINEITGSEEKTC